MTTNSGRTKESEIPIAYINDDGESNKAKFGLLIKFVLNGKEIASCPLLLQTPTC